MDVNTFLSHRRSLTSAALRDAPAAPERKHRRPNTAPTYYLGHPAAIWIGAMRPHHSRATARG